MNRLSKKIMKNISEEEKGGGVENSFVSGLSNSWKRDLN